MSFGLAHYASSEFELFAEELLMSDSIIKVTDTFLMNLNDEVSYSVLYHYVRQSSSYLLISFVLKSYRCRIANLLTSLHNRIPFLK